MPAGMLPRLGGGVDGPARPALDYSQHPEIVGKGHRQGAERERSHAEDCCSDHR